MNRVALQMLFGDRAKYLGLVFGIAFATLLITQQSSIFVGIMIRTSSYIYDVEEADLWIMDSSVRYADTIFPMRDTELSRVRGVPGLAWAVPFFRANTAVRTTGGSLENAVLLGVDDATLIGVPNKVLAGSVEALRQPDAVAIDRAGFMLLWPNEPLAVGKTLELNDRRAVVTTILEASAPFASQPILYTRYSLAMRYTNNGRNQMSFIVARTAPGHDPQAVAAAITAKTGLQALTTNQFRWKTVEYFLANTGIPVNFGTVIGLGVIVGIVVVGLTFHMFVTENIKQYAALKAIGVKNGGLVSMVLLQSAVVGAIGYSIGMGMAAAFFQFTSNHSVQLRGLYLPWQIAVGVAALMGVIVLISTLASLRKVLVLDPAVVFRT